MTRAMLLCAGFGTRLGKLSDERPKPMLPVCDIPILRFGLAMLAGQGIRDIVINLHHRGEIIQDELGDGTDLGVQITYVREPALLGTGGGLKNALSALDPDDTDEPFVSLNGKLIFDVDISGLLSAFAGAPDSLGMMVVRRVPDALTWGAVDVDVCGPVPQVRDILGRGQYMFGGVHVTRPSVVRRLPDGEACMVRQGYLPWLRQGQHVAAFVADSAAYFAEHSTPARYLQSNIDLMRGAHLRFPPGLLAGVHSEADVHPSVDIRPPVYIGKGARIGASAAIGPDAVIGKGATVASGVSVQRSVVWPSVSVHTDIVHHIVTPTALVDASPELLHCDTSANQLKSKPGR